MASELKIGVVGCSGRMGQMVVAQVSETTGCAITAGCEYPGHELIGRDIGAVAGIAALGVAIGGDAAAMIAGVDVVVDFTIPDATIEHARLAAQAGAAMVIGTTGLDPAQADVIAAAARHVPVVWAPNMSVGVTVLLALSEQVAGLLGPDEYDIEIVEMHHRHKIDAPSGTALGLGGAAAAGRRSGQGVPGGARWPYRRAATRRDRLCGAARRRCGRRTFGRLRRRGRADRPQPYCGQPKSVRRRRGARSIMDAKPASGSLFDEERAWIRRLIPSSSAAFRLNGHRL